MYYIRQTESLTLVCLFFLFLYKGGELVCFFLLQQQQKKKKKMGEAKPIDPAVFLAAAGTHRHTTFTIVIAPFFFPL